MVQTGLIILSLLIQLVTLYIILRTRSDTPQPGGEAEKPRRFITPNGIFAVESTKRIPKVNDDESLFEREKER